MIASDGSPRATPLIECIPNFSEARRPEVVDRIADAITSVPGAWLLDRSSDLDHNRTVLTFAGAPQAVEEAAFRAISTASELIDLEKHTGQHPRIGATDVVPFVPLAGATMQDCVDIARRVGARVGTELGVPVYLYEAAAQRPGRTNLEDIRRGQYELLKSEIETDPEREPDFGPARLGPAGATVIGARNPLIAFNLYLATDAVEVAREVAKAVRQSSGGLPNVKALGLLVDGRAQVSMNLTNYRVTSLARVVDAVRREASQRGTDIHHGELIGLIPQEALTDAAVEWAGLAPFEKRQVLEIRLQEASEAQATPPSPSFLDELAAPTPTPGGGSAAAYAAAMGAALVAMVAGVTAGKKKFAAVEAEMQAIRVLAERLRAELTQAVDDDAGAFEAVMGANRLPKSDDAERQARAAAIQNATMNAAHVPLHVAEGAVKVMELAAKCAQDANPNAISDSLSAFSMARAALTAAGYNVRINLAAIEDNDSGERMLQQLSELEQHASRLEKDIQKAARDHAAF